MVDLIDANTVGYWPFDETQNVVSTRVLAVAFAGQSFGRAIFDGTNDAVLIGAAAALRFERNQPFSISCWAIWGQNSQMTIWSNIAVTTARGIDFFLTSTGTPRLRLINTNPGNECAAQAAGTLLADSAEHQVTVTYDGSSTPAGIRWYVDNVLVANATTTNTLSATIVSTGAHRIGRSGDFATGNFYNGGLRHVAVWDKELTALEVAEAHGGGTPPDLLATSMAANLAGWWKLDQLDTYNNTANGIVDHSAGSNPGTGEGGLALYTGSGVTSIFDRTPIRAGGPRQFRGLGQDHCRWFNPTTGGGGFAQIQTDDSQSISGDAWQKPVWTLEGYFYLDRELADVGASQQLLTYDRTAAGGNNLGSTFVLVDGTVRHQWESTGPTLRQATSTLTVPVKQWFHLVLIGTINGANRDIQFYIDGVNAGLATGLPRETGVSSYTNQWYFGATTGNTLPFFGGMAYIRLSRRARTLVEIAAAVADPVAIALDADTANLWLAQDPPQVTDQAKHGLHAMERGLIVGSNPAAAFDFWGVTGPFFAQPAHQFLNAGSFETSFDVPYRQFVLDLMCGQSEYTLETFVRPDNGNTHALLAVGGTVRNLNSNNVVTWQFLSNRRFQIQWDGDDTFGWYARTTLEAVVLSATQSGELGAWYDFAYRKKAAGLKPYWKFDGVDDAVSMGDVAPFQFERTTPFTLMIRGHSITTALQHLMGKSESDATPAGYQLYLNASGQLTFRIENAANQRVEVRASTASPGQANGYERMWAVTYTGSSTAAGVLLYNDGAVLGTVTVANTLAGGSALTTAPFTIGRRNLADQPMNGYLKEAAVFDRVLTPSEITEAFGSAGRPPVDLLATSMAADLIGYWKFDASDTSLVVNDHSVSGIDGTPQGGLAPTNKLSSTIDFFVNGLPLESIGPLPDPAIGNPYLAAANAYYMSLHSTNDQWSRSITRLSDIARTDLQLFEFFAQGSTGVVPAEFDVIPISPAPDTQIEPTEPLIFDVRCTVAIQRIVLKLVFPGFPFSEVAYAQNPSSGLPFEPVYAVGSRVAVVTDPGFFRYRFTLLRTPLWPDSPDLTVYAFAQGTEA